MESQVSTKSAVADKKQDQGHKRSDTDIKIGQLRYVDYVGLGCQTSNHDHPYFFLFADVDTKDPEVLRLALQVYAKHSLSFYYYETSKGWHIVSPCLLELGEWDRCRMDLSDVLDNYYRNLVIRVEWKFGDSKQLFWDNFNIAQRHKESYELHMLFEKRFKTSAKSPNRVPTQLFFTHFSQVRRIDV